MRPSLPRVALLAAMLAASLYPASPARAGHEFPFYPSYYPQEITLSVVAPDAAPAKFADGSLHAYAGADPFAGRPLPPAVTRAESLGSYVVVTLNAASHFSGDAGRRCLAARAVAGSLQAAPGYRAYPYPVTPNHPDYLQHADLVGAAGAGGRATWDGPPLRVRAGDAEAVRLIPAAERSAGPEWDAMVGTVEVSPLWTEAALGPNGGVGVPWLKMGWHHAYLVLRDGIADAAARQRADALHERLTAGASMPERERLTLERDLVSALRAGCERTIAGYTLRTEPLNADYAGGVENVAYDAQAGLGSATFPRTVKLKDFPWNGWLTVGVPERAAAAWNPVAGFTDPTGRLLWLALGDPAFFPSPHGTAWVPNRVTVASVELGAPTIAVPEDALAFEPGSGTPRKVGPGRRAGARVVYRVLASRFHDQTKLEVADLLYAVGLAWRSQDPAVVRATARTRESLVALRLLRTETDVLAFGEDKLTYEVPIVEVYLDRAAASSPDDAVLAAPPWTTVPWPVLALSEEAAARGLAALSRESAEARGLPWLDLARDPALVSRLRGVVDELTVRAYVPAPLAGLVTPAEAKARWEALRAFHATSRHFLVTNGPYRLTSWSESTSVLQVFRDLSYPRGLGVFNSHVFPIRAFITGAEARGDELVLKAEMERVDRFGREYRIVREPFVKRVVEQDRRSLPVGHYVAIGPDAGVAAAGAVEASDPGEFHVDLRVLDRPGNYMILVALTIDDNRTELPVKAIPWTR
jgi:hypothetical protein